MNAAASSDFRGRVLFFGDKDEVRGNKVRTSLDEGEKTPLGEICDLAVSMSSSVETSRTGLLV